MKNIGLLSSALCLLLSCAANAQILADDFNGITINSALWTTYNTSFGNSSITEGGGNATFINGAGLITVSSFVNATVQGSEVTVAPGDYGPVPQLMASLLGVARSGGLDALLLENGRFFQTDFTRPLLFMGDGNYLPGLAADQHLTGDQWGMMNETGLYPGQTWLWLFSFWYQVPPFNTASNTDLVVIILMIVLTAILALVPFIPILRDIPRWIPVHRLIWRRYYRG